MLKLVTGLRKRDNAPQAYASVTKQSGMRNNINTQQVLLIRMRLAAVYKLIIYFPYLRFPILHKDLHSILRSTALPVMERLAEYLS